MTRQTPPRLTRGRTIAAGALSVLLLALVSGCGSVALERPQEWADLMATEAPTDSPDRVEITPSDVVLIEGAEYELNSAESDPSTPSPPPVDAGDSSDEKKPKRLVIYTANFSLLVANAKESLVTFLQRIEQLGGYMEQRSLTSLTVRVPAKTFEPILDELRAMGKVLSEQVDAIDVTRQFRDTTIRLETAEKSRQRLLEILANAEKTEDILKIEEQLRRLVTEIETLKAELRTLSDRIAYSTITVDFQQNAPPPRKARRDATSRFRWINRVGIEQTLADF